MSVASTVSLSPAIEARDDDEKVSTLSDETVISHNLGPVIPPVDLDMKTVIRILQAEIHHHCI